MPQNATNIHHVSQGQEEVSLSLEASPLLPEQRQAIQLLLLGKTITEVSAILNKDRKTLYRWRENPHFLAVYNELQGEMFIGIRGRLQSLTEKAVDVLQQHLEQGNLKAALELLKIINLYGNVPSSAAATDPELILKAQAEEIAIAEVNKTPFSNMRRPNDFARKLAGDIAEVLKEKYGVKASLLDLVSENEDIVSKENE